MASKISPPPEEIFSETLQGQCFNSLISYFTPWTAGLSNRNRDIVGSSTGWAQRVESEFRSFAPNPLVIWAKPFWPTRGKIKSPAAFGSVSATPFSLALITINRI